MRPRDAWLGTLFAWAACTQGVACAPYTPPFTQAVRADAPPAAHQATVVFLWPESSCDPAGYFTLVTSDGRFVGTIARGKQLRAELPAGEATLVGWNEVREEGGGAGQRAIVPVLRAHLAEGRTYYVRMLLGEWDEGGPAKQRWAWAGRSRIPMRMCAAVLGNGGVTSAMVTVTPASPSWKLVPELTAKLEALAPDRRAGQAWADEQGEALRAHLASGVERYEALRPEARRMATLEAEDGVEAGQR